MGNLIKIFANESLANVLTLFCLNPASEFFQKTIADRTGKRLIQVQRSLKTLEDIGLITSRKEGRMIFYKAEPTHPAFQDLKNIFMKTISLGDTLRKALEQYAKQIDFAWIYGSVAQGKEKSDSDIDLVMISDLSLKELSQITEPLTASLNRELNPLFMSPFSLIKRIQEGDHFVAQLMQGEKIWIIGDDRLFRRFIRARVTENP